MTYDVVQHTRKLRELLESQAPFATITLLDIRGSAPQIIGAKAIVTSSGIESAAARSKPPRSNMLNSCCLMKPVRVANW